jgi:Tol biopolymer transport system component
MKSRQFLLVLVGVGAALIFGSIISAQHFGDWAAPVSMESIPGTSLEFNTAFNDGCPYQAPDGLSFYMASNRPGGLGGQDIWVAYRSSANEPFGAPVNLPAPVNSAADDFCPTPVRGKGLYFVSARAGGCGGADIYFSRLKKDGWEEPQNLGCDINSPAGEASPSYFEDDAGNSYLYFSSNRAGGFEPGGADSDIYYSLNFGAAQLAPGLNTASDDFRPNVRKDGREIVFDSNRAGGLGGFDIWTSSRENVSDDWLAPLNLTQLNSAANETRASFSWDGLQLVFGSNRPGVEGQADIFVTTREKLRVINAKSNFPLESVSNKFKNIKRE